MPTLDARLANQLVDALLRVPSVEDRATRTELLTGIPTALNRSDNAFVDLSGIIRQLDGLGRLTNGERPVVIVASNARRMARGTELGKLLEELETEIESSYSNKSDGVVLADVPTQPEALIFGGPGEWVTSAFLEQARLVGERVARLRVPRFVGAKEEDSVGALGTGWLITPELLLTNHHIVNARDLGEPAATEGEFVSQAKHTVAWFDYYTEGRGRAEVKIADVICRNSNLDYALLRLERHDALRDRKPIALPRDARKLVRGMRLNVVQCPGGGPLRFAIRNNFFVGRGSAEYQIRYLTDTVQGSSGSPVMDDDWQVVALHHGAQEVDAKLYKGEPGLAGVAKFHNQGIDIHNILADLPRSVNAQIGLAQGWS
jgi:hypothetical protein